MSDNMCVNHTCILGLDVSALARGISDDDRSSDITRDVSGAGLPTISNLFLWCWFSILKIKITAQDRSETYRMALIIGCM